MLLLVSFCNSPCTCLIPQAKKAQPFRSAVLNSARKNESKATFFDLNVEACDLTWTNY